MRTQFSGSGSNNSNTSTKSTEEYNNNVHVSALPPVDPVLLPVDPVPPIIKDPVADDVPPLYPAFSPPAPLPLPVPANPVVTPPILGQPLGRRYAAAVHLLSAALDEASALKAILELTFSTRAIDAVLQQTLLEQFARCETLPEEDVTNDRKAPSLSNDETTPAILAEVQQQALCRRQEALLAQVSGWVVVSSHLSTHSLTTLTTLTKLNSVSLTHYTDYTDYTEFSLTHSLTTLIYSLTITFTHSPTV
jgi:hypothetical protein